MNPVENKQPSEWAIEKAAQIWTKSLVSSLLMHVDLCMEFTKELNFLKSQADGLATALEAYSNVMTCPGIIVEEGVVNSGCRGGDDCPIHTALEAYRKGK